MEDRNRIWKQEECMNMYDGEILREEESGSRFRLNDVK